jgi:carotenoid cleavage dioxygenase
MPRGGGTADVTWFDVDPCYVFHPMNSFETTGTDGATSIVLDTARYPDLWRQDSARFNNDAALHRWTFDLTAGTVKEQPLDDRTIEFPRVHEDLVGLANRYGYAVANLQPAGDGPPTSQLVKYDLEADISSAHDFGTSRIPGEAVFVPSADAAAEDDGWLLAYVYDKTTESSEFIVLDARDIAADPVATVALPQRVPFGFHGSWMPD